MDFRLAVDKAALNADKFVERFYKFYDSKRQNLSPFYAAPGVVLLWNGRVFQGWQTISAEFFTPLPPTVHDIQTVDSQPVATANGPATDGSFIVTVSGTVRYNEEAPRLFSHQFILTAPDSVTTLISSECLRFT